ncbi:MAG: flavin-binding monooxygenase subfamily, partial [Myxococcota bacterium]
RLVTADGAILDDVDAVVFCTGYRNRVAFLPEALQECDPRGLYKHMFHPEFRERMAWIGWARPGFGSQFPIMEMQARLFALVCAGKHRLPDPATLQRVGAADRDSHLEQFEENARKIRSLVDYHHYMDDLAQLIGCEPPLWSYALRHPRLWRAMVYGPTQATQYRLRGPGKKVEVAHEILAKLPVSGWNHVVKAGLRGRLEHALRGLLPRDRKKRRAQVVTAR